MRSLKLAVISTLICLLMGYPIAYIMARAKGTDAEDNGHAHHDPHVMNFLIRTYAWMTILQDTGIFNGLSPRSVSARCTSSAPKPPLLSAWCMTIFRI